jgi:ABC-type sugar transport system substrate-binding protein
MKPGKPFIFMLVLLIPLLLQACARDSGGPAAADPGASVTENEPPYAPDAGGNADGKPVIGATFLGTNEFVVTMMNTMIEEAKARGVELIALNAEGSIEKQLDHIRSFVDQRVDVIILNPVEAEGGAEGVEIADAAGIPVVGVNAVINQSEKFRTYVGSNDLEAGEIEMRFIAEELKGEGNIVVMEGITAQSSQMQRTQGILNTLRGYPKIRILEIETGNWSRDEGYALMNAWWQKHGEQIDAVVSHNDKMALGAIRFMEEQGLIGKIKVIGVDGTPDGLRAVKEGKMDAVLFQDAKGQAVLALDLAIRIFHHDHVARTYHIPFKLVTKYNVDQFMNPS